MIFWLVETLIYFSDISASDLCRCHTYMPVFFSSSENIVLKQILDSGQWKRIYRLVEAISFQYFKYPFHWKQFFHLLEIYFKWILYHSQWHRISCLLETTFFHSNFFQNHYCNWREVNIFLKILFLLLQRKPFSSFFSDTDANRSSFSVQWNRIFQGILHSGLWNWISKA